MKVFVYEASIVIYNSLRSCLKIYSQGAESISFDAPIMHHWRYREKAMMIFFIMTMINDDVNNGNELFAFSESTVPAQREKKKKRLQVEILLNNSVGIALQADLPSPSHG